MQEHLKDDIFMAVSSITYYRLYLQASYVTYGKTAIQMSVTYRNPKAAAAKTARLILGIDRGCK